jgi:LPXTG-motif cell wall-anchored protein
MSRKYMKKLALAPAVAIAITGLAASPVVAATEAPASAPSADTQPAESPAAKTSTLQKADAQDATAEKGEIAVSADKVSVEDFAKNGIGIAGAGLEADTEYKLTVEPASGQKVNAYETTVTTDAEGAFEDGVEAVGEANPAFVGGYKVVVKNDSDENAPYNTSFEVTEGDDTDEPEAPEVDPKISVADKELTKTELVEDGIKVEGEGFTPGGDVKLSAGSPMSTYGDNTVKADKDGKISGTVKGTDDVKTGEHDVFAVDQDSEERAELVTVKITEDEKTEDPSTPAEEAKLTVSPESITPADFVNEEKAVTLAVENCEPGEDVRFLVNPAGKSDVTAFDETIKADDEGKASVNVYGTSADDPSAYIGDYDVTVTCGDDELTGDFSVEKDPNAGGGDGDEDGNEDGGNGGDNGNGGGDLPRTGTELTGLVGGAGLLLIGGVAVALTMRRKKVAQDPSEI